MRLHWCALDDPGGALGLKNRLIRPVKMINSTPATLILSYYRNEYRIHILSYCISLVCCRYAMGLRRSSRVIVIISVTCFTMAIIIWRKTTDNTNILGQPGKLVNYMATCLVARFTPINNRILLYCTTATLGRGSVQ